MRFRSRGGSPAPDHHSVTPGSGLVEEIRRRPARLVLACVATALGPAIVAAADVPGSAAGATKPGEGRPSTAVVEFPLPGNLASCQAPARQAAGTCPVL